MITLDKLRLVNFEWFKLNQAFFVNTDIFSPHQRTLYLSIFCNDATSLVILSPAEAYYSAGDYIFLLIAEAERLHSWDVATKMP